MGVLSQELIYSHQDALTACNDFLSVPMTDEIKSRVSVIEDRQDRFERSVESSIRDVKDALVRMEATLEKMVRIDERQVRMRDDISTLEKRILDLESHSPLNTHARQQREKWNMRLATGSILVGISLLIKILWDAL